MVCGKWSQAGLIEQVTQNEGAFYVAADPLVEVERRPGPTGKPIERQLTLRYLAPPGRRAPHVSDRGTQGCPPQARQVYDLAVKSPTVLVMAAGEGTRMRSSLPKMLHPVFGRPMVTSPSAYAPRGGGRQDGRGRSSHPQP